MCFRSHSSLMVGLDVTHTTFQKNYHGKSNISKTLMSRQTYASNSLHSYHVENTMHKFSHQPNIHDSSTPSKICTIVVQNYHASKILIAVLKSRSQR
jgi:hypothetical protein